MGRLSFLMLLFLTVNTPPRPYGVHRENHGVVRYIRRCTDVDQVGPALQEPHQHQHINRHFEVFSNNINVCLD